jgi:hypothetical protein
VHAPPAKLLDAHPAPSAAADSVGHDDVMHGAQLLVGCTEGHAPPSVDPPVLEPPVPQPTQPTTTSASVTTRFTTASVA